MKELSVVIPVMNEFQNVEPMIKAVQEALRGIDYELIFVDDGLLTVLQKKSFVVPTKEYDWLN